MSTQSQPQEEQLTAAAIADYLREHPDFFLDQHALLTDLRIPHAAGSAVSLIERQVVLLRQQNDRLKHKLKDLVEVGEANERLTDCIHRLTLNLLDARSTKDVIDALHERLRKDFNVDTVAIRLRVMPEESMPEGLALPMESGDPLLKTYEEAFAEGRPVCGGLGEEQIQYAFAGSRVAVKSAAIVPLRKTDVMGYLGLGSPDADHFHSSKDTLFLRYLGSLSGYAFARFQTPEAAQA